MTTKKQREQQEALDDLRAMLNPGDVIYTRTNHTSRSGMMRVIDLFVIRNNEPLRITWAACKAIGWAYNNKHEGMRVDGCGMDIGFHAVYCLGFSLWPDGTPESHGTRNGEPDYDGGYALKQRWI